MVELSKAPPIECIELAVDPRRGLYLSLEPGLCDESYRGNGYSLSRRGDVGDVRLSIDCRVAGKDIMFSRPRRPLLGWSTTLLTFTDCHRDIIAGLQVF